MSFEKKTSYIYTISEDGSILVQALITVLEDGQEVARAIRSRSLSPLDDVESESDNRLKAIANAVWDQKTKDDYAEKKAKNPMGPGGI